MRRAERDEPADAARVPARPDVRARDQPAHAVSDDVDPGGTRRAPDAIERLAEAARAPLDVATHGGVGDGVEVSPPVALEPARKPEEVRGVLRIAVQQDDRRVRIARLEPRHAPAAERERRRQTQERGRRALYGEGPGARRPRGALLLVRRARGRMAPAVAWRPPPGAPG